MNQIQFETSKVFGVFVMLPDGAKAWKNERYYTMRLPKAIDLPNENYKIVGFVSELTDEQKEGVCEDADEFTSLLTSLNVLLVNPYGENPCQPKHRGYCEDYCQGDCWTNSNIDYDDWQTAQQHVGQWCLLTCDK